MWNPLTRNRDVQLDRVQAEIDGLRAQFEALGPATGARPANPKRKAAPPAGDAPTVGPGMDKGRAAFQALLDKAERLREERKLEPAWQVVHDAKEQLVLRLPQERLLEAAATLRMEAPHLEEGERDYVLRRLADPDLKAFGRERLAGRVHEAMVVRNDYWNSFHYGAQLIRIRVFWLMVFLAAAAAAVITFAWVSDVAVLAEEPAASTGWLALLCFAVGVLGGATSSILSAAGGDHFLPSIAKDAPWAMARPLFGGASGLLAAVLASGGVLGLSADGVPALLAVSAIAGFSESFLVKAMSRAAERAADEKRGASTRGKPLPEQAGGTGAPRRSPRRRGPGLRPTQQGARSARPSRPG